MAEYISVFHFYVPVACALVRQCDSRAVTKSLQLSGAAESVKFAAQAQLDGAPQTLRALQISQCLRFDLCLRFL